MIDGEGLAAFVAITDLHSFSLAAQRLGIAQSVISKRLRRLEDQFGKALIDPGQGTFVPLSFAPGEAFQFGWSEDWAIIDDVRTKLQVAHFKIS